MDNQAKHQVGFTAGVVALVAVTTGAVAGFGGYTYGSMKARLSYLEDAQTAAVVASLQAPAQSQQIQLQPQINATPQQAVPQQQFAATPDLPQSVAPAQTIQTGLNAEGVPTQAAPVFDNPELAGQLLQAFSQTNGVRTEGSAEATGHPVYAFIDPRCPYCQKAVGELVGQVPVHWIPTTLLGDTENGIKIVEAMFQTDDKAVAMVEGHAGTLTPIAASAETRQAVNENAAVLYSVMGGAERSLAVPTILVPRPDGTISFYRGFDEGDGAKIVADYGG